MHSQIGSSSTNSPVTAFPSRRRLPDPRQDHETRATIYCNSKLKEAESLPEGPEREAALAELVRITKDARAGASDRRKAQALPQNAGWSGQFAHA